ncbi:MAG: glycosyltransferase family 4 protein, partial [Candidatus Staskawiczbacteria bacterium]
MAKASIIYKLAIISTIPLRYHVQLYRELANSPKINLTVYFCLDWKFLNQPDNIFFNKNFLNGYNYKFLKNYSPFTSLTTSPFYLMNFGIWKEIKKNQYDAVIIHAWNNFTWWLTFFTCLRFKTPVLFMTDASNLSNSSRPAWKKWLKKIYFKKILFKNAAGFLISGSVNENFYKEYGVPKKKMIELHYSYGYEDFLTAAKELKLQRQNIRKYSGIKDNDFVLLFVGRLDEVKNIFTLLKAYKGINYKNKKLFIVGDGPLRNQIEKCIKNLNIEGVFLAGLKPKKKLFDFYAFSDALILPSTDEPWGMVINEAMCFGLPIIASDKVGAAVDLVQDGY